MPLEWQQRGLTFVHPFDDPDVIAGQGTIAMEILRQHQGPIDAVFVAIGGGGLISGIAAYIKAVRPEIKVIGVQIDRLRRDAALGARRQARDSSPTSACSPTAPRSSWSARRPSASRARSSTTSSSSTPTPSAPRSRTSSRTRAASSSRPARWAWRRSSSTSTTHKLKGQTFVAITCGANMNFDRLRFVAERAEVGEEREALFAVTIPEERGRFKRFCELIGPRAVTEFNYRISDASVAHVFVGVAIANRDEADTHRAQLRAPRLRHRRPDRRRAGQGARAPHGRRPHPSWHATSASTASSSPSGRAR